MTRFRSIAPTLGFAVLLAGCAQQDPFASPGSWHETHAATRNIAAELVSPQDLTQGRGDLALSGPIADAAIGEALKSGGGGSGTSAGAGSSSSGSAVMGSAGTSSGSSAPSLAQ